MSVVFVVLIIVAVIAIAVPLAIAHSRAVDKAWRVAARELNLSHSAAAFLKSRSIVGNLRGFQVDVDTYTQRSGKHSKTFTRFRIAYPKSLSLGLRLTREGMLSSVTKFFGAQDIELGDAGFDSSVIVKGSNENRVRAFLTPARRLRVQRFLSNHQSAVIEDQSISWSRQGVVSNSTTIVATVQAMLRVAWHLADDREADERLAKAMRLQNAGSPEEAMQVIEAAVVNVESESTDGSTAGFLEEPVEEKLMQAELQYLAGDRLAAHGNFEEMQHVTPDDPEIDNWVEFTKSPQSPIASGPVVKLDAKILCDDLFANTTSSYEVSRIFESKYQDREVEWQGELQKVERNYSSFIFEQADGLKATFKIDERPSPYYGTQDVLAVVHLESSAGESLQDQIGEVVRVKGTLVKADGLMRNVYLDKGMVVFE